MKRGDIVKFDGREEPCVVYRITDETIEYGWFQFKEEPRQWLPHIRIEVIGLVPTKYLVPTIGHPENMFALDKMLHMNHQTQ